jgi:DNA polymerase-3 subunit gamma/tau
LFFKTRARKKKWLTERVDILPFPNQTLRKKPTPAKTVASVPVSIIPQEVKPVVLTAPAGSVDAPHISIKKILEEQNTNKSSLSKENEEREPFTREQLKMFWKRFAFQMKENSMETFYNALIKREPVFLDDEKLVIEVENKVQIDYINPLLNEFVSYLRKNLKNYSITVDLKLSDEQVSEVKFLTGKDKFATMARKNTNLHKLKNLFNLDIEF